MTRQEAERIMAQRGWPLATVDVYIELGMLKLDESKPDSALVYALHNTMVEVGYRKEETAGRLTLYGAGCVLERLKALGYEVVKK